LRMGRHRYDAPERAARRPRVDGQRVLDVIFWVVRSGALGRDLPESYGPRSGCYNRFIHWRLAGVWDRIGPRLFAGKMSG
jgi:transposase